MFLWTVQTENAVFIRTNAGNQVLCQTRKNLGGDFWNDQEDLFRWFFGEKWCVPVTQGIFGRPEELADEARVGQSSISSSENNVRSVREILNTDRRMSVRLVAQTLGVPKSIVCEIVTNDLQMRKVWTAADDCKLHYCNAPATTTFLMTIHLAKAKVLTILQPSYSSDVAL